MNIMKSFCSFVVLASGVLAQFQPQISVRTGPDGVQLSVLQNGWGGVVFDEVLSIPAQVLLASSWAPGPFAYSVVAPPAFGNHAFATLTLAPNVWPGSSAGGFPDLGRTLALEWRAGTSGILGPVFPDSRVDFDLVVDLEFGAGGQGLQVDGLLRSASFEAGEADVSIDAELDGTFEVVRAAGIQGSVLVRGDVLMPEGGNGQIRVRGSCTIFGYGDTAAGTLFLRISPAAAVAVRAGESCGGSSQAPALRWGTARPEVGTLFPMTVQNVPANSNLVLGLVGFDTGSWLGVPLPLDLGAAGMPGCVLQVDPVMPWITALPIASASAQWWLPIPGIGELIGVRFVAQALVDAPGANAAGLLLSNGVRGHIGT